MLTRQIRIVSGVLIWIALLSWSGIRYLPAWFGDESPAGRSLTTYLLESKKQRTLKFENFSNVRIGDPVFLENADGMLIQIGAIRQVNSPESQEYGIVSTDWASATFFSSAPQISQRDYLTIHQTPKSMDWVARFLFPPERREKIARMVAEVYTTHSEEILNELMPILQAVWSEASIMIRDELLESLARHKPEFDVLGARYQIEIVDAELLPLLGDEISPIVLEHARPVMESVGEQIWQQASVFRFGWRALYDASPLPRRDLTQAEFARFVENDAVPVLTEHLPQFLEAQQLILQDIVANPRVQNVVTGSLKKISEDPDMQRLILQVLRESILDNTGLQNLMIGIWERPDMQNVMSLTDSRLEPTVVSIGEEVFGSPYTGVTPEFARILRNKILLKDDRWLILHQPKDEDDINPVVAENTDAQALIVLPGGSTMENPFYYPAKKR